MFLLLLILGLGLGLALAMTPQNLNQCLTKNVHLVARSLGTFLRSESVGIGNVWLRWVEAVQATSRRLWLVND